MRFILFVNLPTTKNRQISLLGIQCANELIVELLECSSSGLPHHSLAGVIAALERLGRILEGLFRAATPETAAVLRAERECQGSSISSCSISLKSVRAIQAQKTEYKSEFEHRIAQRTDDGRQALELSAK